MSGGGTTISTSETRIEALSLQSSAYGVTVPLVYGVNRISGNMLWYGDFKAIAHTSSSGSGGKGGGGGVTQVSTTYTYTASVMMALTEGQAIGVSKVWRGKKLYQGGVTPSQILSVIETFVVPAGGGVFTVANSAQFVADTGVSFAYSDYFSYGVYSTLLSEGVQYTRAGGVYTFAAGVFQGSTPVYISYQYNAGGATQTSLQQLGLSFAAGGIGQSIWPYLTTKFPDQAIGYSGLAYVYAQDYDLGSNASIDNHSFEVQGAQAYSIAGSLPDANPSTAAIDVLINGRYGAGFTPARIDDSTAWSAYCLSAGLVMSPTLTEQMQAGEFVSKVCALTNTAPVWSGGRLKMIPYGDTAISGNGATYTPNLTPAFDLTDDDFTPSVGDDPIKVTRKPQADAYNHIRIEFNNRANYYNVEIAEAKDSANIDAFGLRSADVLTAHWICDAAVARTVAQLLLQRAMYIRNTYEFQLPWTRAMLEPMDLVTLTDSGLGFNKLAVRVTEVSESDAGDLSIVAEDFPVGVAHAALYTSQSGVGFLHDYNAAPGSVLTPMIFEAPVERTTTGLEVYAAVRGTAANWGGCRVWTSLDGVQYKDSGLLYGGARYGALTGPISGDSLPVTINGGQMLSGSATDSANLSTLCYIGGATPEYLAHGTATLTGALAYTLTGLTRSAFTTSGAAHSTGDAFARLDDAIAKSGPLDLSMIGKTIYFKFTSFNIYKAAEQSLANVTAYPYVVTGAMAALPPPDVAGLTIEGVKLTWSPVVAMDLAGYRLKYQYGANLDWGTASQLHTGLITDSPYSMLVVPPGQITIMARAVDTTGNESLNSAYVITNMGNSLVANVMQSMDFRAATWPGTMTNATLVGGNLQATQSDPFFRTDAANAFPLDGAAYYSANYDALDWDSAGWTPSAAAAGSKMTAAWTLTGDAVAVQYRQTGPSLFFGQDVNQFFDLDANAFFAAPGAWLAWPGALTAQNQEYQWRVTTTTGPTTGLLSAFTVSVDVPDKNLKLNAVAIAPGGTRLSGAIGQFNVILNIQLTLQGGSTAVSLEISDYSNPLGPLAVAKNAAGTSVSATIDALLQGY